jgi:hypothetical protein
MKLGAALLASADPRASTSHFVVSRCQLVVVVPPRWLLRAPHSASVLWVGWQFDTRSSTAGNRSRRADGPFRADEVRSPT